MITNEYLCLRLGLRPSEIPQNRLKRQQGPHVLQIRVHHHAGEKSLNVEITSDTVQLTNNCQSLCHMTNADLDAAMRYVLAITTNAKEIKRLVLKDRGTDWVRIWDLIKAEVSA
ncbi:hypothetical protein [Thalassobius sp. Cn5-15]|uniref:hypothetical protein n=1 Tax=Thalassobius sp. Cn5-15 TaxID=2917763 RepID=UPI001EF2CF75|nr:hypothetical protein [Thalassobius sp. Cn5-15]MCG7492424.1 hypothetical protein [Thalassobius sp. Cn5-15]